MLNAKARQQREDGAAALSLLVTAMVIALSIVLYMVLPLATASDGKATSRTAADAAALAGADQIRTDLETVLTSAGWLGSWAEYQPLLGTGLANARNYAERNGSTLIAYDFNALRWEAHATVESPEIKDGMKPVSEATAQLDFPECSSQEAATPPPPEPTEDDEDDKDTDEPDEPPKEPPPPDLELSCGGLDLKLVPVKEGDDVRYELPDWAISDLLDMATIKLVS